MNFEDLWIGDLVYVRSMKRNGKWEGLIDNKRAQVRIDHSTVSVPISDISEAKEEPSEMSLSLPENDNSTLTSQFDGNSLDLHIEKLKPSLLHQSAEQILLHQIRQAKAFVEFAISRKWVTILIIHGKGSGLLKHEVYHLLEDFSEVFHTLEKNNGGAVEIWFKY